MLAINETIFNLEILHEKVLVHLHKFPIIIG